MKYNDERYMPGIGFTAGAMMLKWDELDRRLHQGSKSDIRKGDKVNVFISLESVLLNMGRVLDLRVKVQRFKQQVVIELESAILNLIANYRGYFRKCGCEARLYFYSTSLVETTQQMSTYIKYYRSTYYKRYTQNPRFRHIGELMRDTIIPEVKLILQYVDGAYLIESSNFDGSIIPLVISRQSENRNVIITSDWFDTLYFYDPNFAVFHIRRPHKDCIICNSTEDAINHIGDRYGVEDACRWMFKTEMYYRILLLMIGDKCRNIPDEFELHINPSRVAINAMLNNTVTNDMRSVTSVVKIFPKDCREQIKTALQCLDLETHYDMLSKVDMDSIESQIVDKVDPKSVEALNNVRFLEFPINLQFLI